MTADPTAILLQYGIAGVAILAESYVIVRLYADNKQLQKEINAEKDARREDVVEVNNKIVPVMSNFSQTANLIYSKLKSSKEEV